MIVVLHGLVVALKPSLNQSPPHLAHGWDVAQLGDSSGNHSAATLLLAQGVSPRYITELLGHSQVSFTMPTYAHVLPEVQKQVATKMDEILNPNGVATSVATKPVSGRPV